MHPAPEHHPSILPSVAAAFVVFAAWSACALHASTRGLPLYNDDHPSFMFRLWVLAKSLPRLVVYNPWWNAGNLEHAAIETGAVAPGLLLRPLWTAFPIHDGLPPRQRACPQCYSVAGGQQCPPGV